VYKVALLPVQDRAALFRAASQKMGVNEAIIEKDFSKLLGKGSSY